MSQGCQSTCLIRWQKAFTPKVETKAVNKPIRVVTINGPIPSILIQVIFKKMWDKKSYIERDICLNGFKLARCLQSLHMHDVFHLCLFRIIPLLNIYATLSERCTLVHFNAG